jgi:hypothetical protein
MYKIIIPVFFAAMLMSCSGSHPGSSVDSAKTDSVKATVVLSDWHSLTESWTASLNLKNASIMKSFYADSVIYYGDKISGADVVKRQQEYFAANPDYHQKIVEYIGEEQTPEGNWRVRITKQVTAGGKTGNYPASLIFGRRNGIWKIILESDDITDLRKGTPLTVHYAPEVITVEGLLEENTGFAPNTTGGDAKSDNKETYFAIWPSQPLDVIATDAQQKEGINITEKNVDHLQVSGNEKELRSMLNKKVKISGTLSHAHTAHQFTSVLLAVHSVSAAD